MRVALSSSGIISFKVVLERISMISSKNDAIKPHIIMISGNFVKIIRKHNVIDITDNISTFGELIFEVKTAHFEPKAPPSEMMNKAIPR